MPNVGCGKVWRIVKDIWSLRPILLPILATLLPLSMVLESESKVSVLQSEVRLFGLLTFAYSVIIFHWNIFWIFIKRFKSFFEILLSTKQCFILMLLSLRWYLQNSKYIGKCVSIPHHILPVYIVMTYHIMQQQGYWSMRGRGKIGLEEGGGVITVLDDKLHCVMYNSFI